MELTGKIISIIGKDVPSLININKEVYVFDKVNRFSSKDRILEALKMVNLDEDYISKKSNDLSNAEYNKLLLARDLINKENIIYLDYFEKGLCFKEREYFKKLINKLAKKYGLTFIIKTNDFSFCLNLVDEFHIFTGNELTKIVPKKDIYKEEIYEYFNKHQLIDFVLKSRKHNHLKRDYYDINEVLKAIYRELKRDILLKFPMMEVNFMVFKDKTI